MDALEETTWLIQTKLQPPLPRSDAIPRPRLQAALQQAVTASRLSLLSAPAGYGKTTLVADFALQRKHASVSQPHSRITWLTLDEGENDPAVFLAYVVAALQHLSPECGRTAQALLAGAAGPTPPIELATRAVGVLINDVLSTLPEPFLLILDDLNRVSEPAIFALLDYLVERMPEQMHLAIATRRDPPLSLARLRARGQLAELRGPDLAFTLDETTSFLNEIARLDLPAGDLEALQARTEGWPAGLRLLATSLATITTTAGRSAFVRELAHTNRYVFDFLADEVLNRQPPQVRTFLLETSILDELTPALCAAITGRPDAAAILADLDRCNLFLTTVSSPLHPLPNPPTFRYHALFAGFLRQQLAHEMPGRAAELHRQAARAESDPARAIKHHLAAGDCEGAAEIVERTGEEMIKQGLLTTLVSWIHALPPGVRDEHPHLTFLLGVCAWQRGDPPVAVACLEEALRRFEAAGDREHQIKTLTHLLPALVMSAHYERVHEVSRHTLAHLIAPASKVQLLMVRGIAQVTQDECQAALGHLHEALAITQAADDAGTWAAQAIHCLSQFSVLPGAIDLVEGICRRAGELFAGQVSVAGMAAAARYTLVHLLRGRVAEAISSAQRALALGQQLGGVSYLGGEATMALAQAQIAVGDYPAARHTLDMAYEFFQQFPHGEAAVGMLFYMRGLIHYHRGENEALLRAVDQIETVHIPGEWTLVEALRSMLAALDAIATGDEARAESTLRQVTRLQAQVPTSTRMGSARAWLAHLYFVQGRPDDALAEFGALLGEAERQGMPGRGLLEGAAAVPLLRLAVARGLHAPLAASLLEAMGQGSARHSIAVPETGETLTSREVEVLRLVAAGLSNPEIAEALVISPHTVKSHVSHILNKMNAASRTEAALRARELGLQ